MPILVPYGCTFRQNLEHKKYIAITEDTFEYNNLLVNSENLKKSLPEHIRDKASIVSALVHNGRIILCSSDNLVDINNMVYYTQGGHSLPYHPIAYEIKQSILRRFTKIIEHYFYIFSRQSSYEFLTKIDSGLSIKEKAALVVEVLSSNDFRNIEYEYYQKKDLYALIIYDFAHLLGMNFNKNIYRMRDILCEYPLLTDYLALENIDTDMLQFFVIKVINTVDKKIFEYSGNGYKKKTLITLDGNVFYDTINDINISKKFLENKE